MIILMKLMSLAVLWWGFVMFGSSDYQWSRWHLHAVQYLLSIVLEVNRGRSCRRNTSRGIYLFCKQYISGLDSYLTFMVALACPDARYKYLANLVILCSFTKIPFLFYRNTFSLSHKYLFSYTQIPYLTHKYLFSFIQIPCQPCNPFSFTQSCFRFLT